MISKESINQLLDLAHVEDVVGEFVTLKRRGSNMIGLCPFHNEKTPSFIVSPSKGIYKCFGCGQSGNSVGFVMEHEQLSYPDALRYLANKYNFTLEETKQTDEEKQMLDERESLYAITNYALEYYQDQLLNTAKGKSIGLSYFKERGFSDQTISKFGLGYAPEGFHNLLNEATSKQFDVELLKKSGLIAEKNGNQFDFFRDRVLFPIHNHAGKVVAFAGRTLKSDKKTPKYINSAESDIYHKSKVLYGLNFAKQEIRRKDNCLLVEGYTDVISLAQAGVNHVVATSGTSLTVDQVKLLQRYTNNFTLLFDGDAAGVKAALRGVDLILPEGVHVQVVLLPEHHDPDSLIKELGHDQFEQFIQSNSKDFILFKLNHILEGKNQDPVKRAEAAKSVISSIALIPDAITRSFYIRECAQELSVDEQLLIFEVNKLRREEHKRKKRLSNQEKKQLNEQEENQLIQPLQNDHEKLVLDKTYFVEKEILRVLLEYGNFDYDEQHSVADYIFYELEGQILSTKELQRVFELYALEYEKNKEITIEQFIKTADEPIVNTIIEVTSLPYELSHNWWDKHRIKVKHKKDEIYQEEVEYTTISYKLFGAQKLLDDKIAQLKQINDPAKETDLLQQVNQLQNLIKESNKSLNRNNYLH